MLTRRGEIDVHYHNGLDLYLVSRSGPYRPCQHFPERHCSSKVFHIDHDSDSAYFCVCIDAGIEENKIDTPYVKTAEREQKWTSMPHDFYCCHLELQVPLGFKDFLFKDVVSFAKVMTHTYISLDFEV